MFDPPLILRTCVQCGNKFALQPVPYCAVLFFTDINIVMILWQSKRRVKRKRGCDRYVYWLYNIIIIRREPNLSWMWLIDNKSILLRGPIDKDLSQPATVACLFPSLCEYTSNMEGKFISQTWSGCQSFRLLEKKKVQKTVFSKI